MNKQQKRTWVGQQHLQLLHVLCALPEVEIPLPSIAKLLSTRTSHSLSQHSSIQFPDPILYTQNMDQTYSKNILIRTNILIMQINIQYNHFKDDKSTLLVEQWWCQNREDDQPKVVTPKSNRTQLGQTNPTKTTKHKKILNKITKSVEANENGRETKKRKLQTKASKQTHLQIENGTV